MLLRVPGEGVVVLADYRRINKYKVGTGGEENIHRKVESETKSGREKHEGKVWESGGWNGWCKRGKGVKGDLE